MTTINYQIRCLKRKEKRLNIFIIIISDNKTIFSAKNHHFYVLLSLLNIRTVGKVNYGAWR